MTTQQEQEQGQKQNQEQQQEQSIDEEEELYLRLHGRNFVENYRKTHNIPNDKKLPIKDHLKEFLSLHCWNFAQYKRLFYNYILFVKQFYPKHHHYDLERFFYHIVEFYTSDTSTKEKTNSPTSYDIFGLHKISSHSISIFTKYRQGVKNIEEKLAFKTLTEEEVRDICLDEYM